jgi:hypothetical protein
MVSKSFLTNLIKMITIKVKCNFCEAEVVFYQSIATKFTFIFFIKLRLLKGELEIPLHAFSALLMLQHKARRIFIELAH